MVVLTASKFRPQSYPDKRVMIVLETAAKIAMQPHESLCYALYRPDQPVEELMNHWLVRTIGAIEPANEDQDEDQDEDETTK